MSTSRQKGAETSKAKIYWAIGIVAAIVVIILLVYNSGILVKSQTAATVGEEEYSVAQVSYYYQTIANNMASQAQQYQAFGVDYGYDTSLSPSEQYYNEEEGVTFADYFLDSALEELQRVTILCHEAEAAGYTLSAEGEEAIDSNLNYLTMYSTQNHVSEASYLKMLYGSYMTKSLFKELLTDSVLADEYAAEKAASFTYSDQELESYYEENADALDSYSYRFCYIYADTETTTDEAGNTVEPTEEETAAAMDEAKAKADSMIAQIQSGTDFNTAAQAYVDESSAESYSDPEYNHKTEVLGSALDSTFSQWMMEAGRTSGELTAIEVPDTGYCVVQFLSRDKGENSYQTMSYRSILVMAETTASEDGSDAAPTEEQVAAAQEQAQALLDQWEDGAATADSFAALAAENSADETTRENGGLTENANRDSLSADLSAWLFAADRKAGDATVLEYTDSTGAVTGYQVVYADSFGEIRWKYQAANALRSADYEDWYAQVQEGYPAALTDKAQQIPSL